MDTPDKAAEIKAAAAALIAFGTALLSDRHVRGAV